MPAHAVLTVSTYVCKSPQYGAWRAQTELPPPQAVTTDEHYANATGGAFSGVVADEQIPSVLVGEIVMTTFLVFAVCMGAINEETKTPLAPFCIGLTVTVDILAG